MFHVNSTENKKNPNPTSDQSMSMAMPTMQEAQHPEEDAQFIEALQRKRETLRLNAALKEQQKEENVKREAAHQEKDQPKSATPVLTISEKTDRDFLVKDIQNVIYALKFEKGPLPQGRIQNFSLLFFALIEQAFLEPLPWQKITVKEGPKTPAMYAVLKAAIRSLNTLNPDFLIKAKEEHAGQYDRVKTLLGGELSLNKNGYTAFAQFLGTINNQPGYLVNEIILRVDQLLDELKQTRETAPMRKL